MHSRNKSFIYAVFHASNISMISVFFYNFRNIQKLYFDETLGCLFSISHGLEKC